MTTKSAEQQLLDAFGELIDDAAARLSYDDFMQMASKANSTIESAIERITAEHCRKHSSYARCSTSQSVHIGFEADGKPCETCIRIAVNVFESVVREELAGQAERGQ